MNGRLADIQKSKLTVRKGAAVGMIVVRMLGEAEDHHVMGSGTGDECLGGVGQNDGIRGLGTAGPDASYFEGMRINDGDAAALAIGDDETVAVW